MSKLSQRAGHRAAMLHPQGRAFKGGGGNPTAFPQKKRCNLKKRTPPIFTGAFWLCAAAARAAHSQRLPPAQQTANCRSRFCGDILRRRFDFPVKTSPLLFHLPFLKKEYPRRCPCLSHSRRGARRVYGGSYHESAFLLPRSGAAQRAGRGSTSAFSAPGDHPDGSRLRAHCRRRPLRPDGPAPL